jgi:hypothetical protein
MSHVYHNNVAANGSQTFNDLVNQVLLKTAEGNDGGNQLFILIDFNIRHLFRAFFSVPIKRNKGLATLANGSVINEKQLSSFGDFLNLRERVELRKRIVSYKQVLFFPKWDLDGPDLRYFGDWNPDAVLVHPSTSFKAGPWVLDGRQMVADAKDMGLMLAETSLYRNASGEDIVIYIHSPFPTEFISQRQWNLGKGPFDAFWSGIRKASDVLHPKYPQVKFIAVSDVNPYGELTKACFVDWKKPDEVDYEKGFFAVPGDPFGVVGSSVDETLIMEKCKISANFLLQLFLPTTKTTYSQFVQTYRTSLWNPSTRLALLQTRQQNKTSWNRPSQPNK